MIRVSRAAAVDPLVLAVDVMALDVLAPDAPKAAPSVGPVRRPAAGASAYYAQRTLAYEALYDAVIAPAVNTG